LEERRRQQLNIEVSENLYANVKARAVRLGVKMGKLVQGLLAVGLYISEDLGLGDTLRAVEEAKPIIFLKAARNDLSHRGFPGLPKLDELIAEAEGFLSPAPQQKQPIGGEKEN
jgi:hypothetical protein